MKKTFLPSLIGLMFLSLLIPTNNGFAAPMQDSLVIMHPHLTEFAAHVINGFEAWYLAKTGTTIAVTTIEKDLSSCYNDVVTWGGVNPLADVWWGGGKYYFDRARDDDLLYRYKVIEDVNITDYLGGWNLKDINTTHDPAWYASALSGFGIVYNKHYLDTWGLPYPTSWDDLTNHEYAGHIVMASPDYSGSTNVAVRQILMEKNDETDASEITEKANITEGWAYWSKVTGNIGEFTTSSHQVPVLVNESTYGIGICIDYYAYDTRKSNEYLDFTFGKATTVAPDPAGILVGATDLTEAKLFMNYLTSTEGQEKVGKYRTPANIKAVPENILVPRAWDDAGNPNSSSFPVIIPFNINLDDALYSPTRKMFHYWLVQNLQKAQDSWASIGGAADEIAHDNAIALHTKLPSNFNGTIGNLTAIDTGSTSQTLWQNEGAANFDAAKIEALMDYTVPNIGLLTPMNATTHPSGTKIDLNIIDNYAVDTVLYHWDDDDNTTLSTPYAVFLPEGDGLHVLRIYANDSSDNWADRIFLFYTDDCENNPPDVSITGINDGDTYSGSIKIGVSVTDESDIVNATIQIKNGVIDETYEIDLVLAAGTWTGSYDLDTTAFPDETYDVTIRVYDVCDNVRTIWLDISINNNKISTTNEELETTSEELETTTTKAPSITPGFEIPLILILLTCSVILRRKFHKY